MHSALLFLCMLLMTLRVAGGPLDDLQANFQIRCDSAEADRAVQMEKLDASYLAALNREIDKTKATGKLDTVLPLIDEAQAVKTAKDPLPELPQGSSLELKQMRAKHTEARAKIRKAHAEALTSLADKMEAALKSQETELTKAGKIDDALAAKQLRTDIMNKENIQSAKAEISSPSANVTSWTSLKEAKMEILSKGTFDVGWLKEEDEATKILVSTFKKPILKQPLLFTHPNCTVQFSFTRPVTQLQAQVFLANPKGDVSLSVIANGKTVKTLNLKGSIEIKAFECSFPPAQEIILKADDNANISFDWSGWSDPQVK